MRIQVTNKIIDTLVEKGYIRPISKENQGFAATAIQEILIEFEEEVENNFRLKRSFRAH
jgi:sugar-specific transcriptional regulator TrmB